MVEYIFQTEPGFSHSVMALVLRMILALVIFPHGAQKLLGLFGGFGYKGTMAYFTQTVGVPYVFGLLAIVAEFFGPLALALGLFTRVAALGIGATMVVAAVTVHRPHGFFMNWFGNQNGEGYEYFLLAIGMALVLIITGGGALSLDYLIATRLF